MLHHTLRGGGSQGVMVLHGFLGSGKNLGSLGRKLETLCPGHCFALTDLTGHGDSPPLPVQPTLDDVATDVLAAATALGATTFIGHSFGGRVAMRARMIAPNKVQRLALLDVSPEPIGKGSMEPVIQAFVDAPAHAPNRNTMGEFFTARGVSEALTLWLLMNLRRTETGVTWKVDRKPLQILRRAMAEESLWDALDHGETMAIRGTASTYITPDSARRMGDLGCPVHELPVGHFVHAEAPDEVASLLGRWLNHAQGIE